MKRNPKPFLVREEEEKEAESNGSKYSSLIAETEEMEESANEEEGKDLREEEGSVEPKGNIKRRKVNRWVNEKVKDRYQKRIKITYYNEEHIDDRRMYKGAYDITLVEQNQRNQAKLLKAEQKRQKLEDRWSGRRGNRRKRPRSSKRERRKIPILEATSQH